MSGRSEGRDEAFAAGSDRPKPREREAMRRTILESAKRLIDRQGIEALTLSAVANEAGIAEAAIHEYFASEQDLLSQLSDSDGEEPQAAPAAEPAPAAEAAPAVQPAAAPEETRQTPASGDYDELMRQQAEALDSLAKRVMVPKSMTKEGTDAVLMRIEARLNMAEQALAALKKGVSSEDKEFADRIAAVAETLEQLQKRFEAFEKRQLTAVAELRLDVHNLSAARPQPAPASSDEADQAPADIPVEAPAEPVLEESKPDAPADKPDYLSSARQAAINAFNQAETKTKPDFSAQLAKWRASKRWWLWSALGVAALLVAAFDCYAFFYSNAF